MESNHLIDAFWFAFNTTTPQTDGFAVAMDIPQDEGIKGTTIDGRREPALRGLFIKLRTTA